MEYIQITEQQRQAAIDTATKNASESIAWRKKASPNDPAAILALLLEYVRHAEGCNAPFGYSCKCGLNSALARAAAHKEPTP